MSTGTFDEIEQRADRTLAYALLVRLAKSYFSCTYRLTEVSRALDSLLGILTPEKLEALTSEQTTWLATRLQAVHSLIAQFSRSSEAETIAKLPILGGLTERLRESTEDLNDVIEDLVLVNDPDFKDLISDCASSIGLSVGETVARMHD